jgi:hypothetical protein
MDISLILSIIATFFAVLSVYLGYLVIKYQKPVFIKETVNIIDSEAIQEITQSDRNLVIRYIPEPEPITNLSATYITFWNAGNIRINQDDIPKNIPICVKAKQNVKIFRLRIMKLKPENGIEYFHGEKYPEPADENRHCYKFEYLGKDEGIKIQLIHSGKSSEDIEFSGKTKDFGAFKDISNQGKKRNRAEFISSIIGSIVFTASFVYLITIIPLQPIMDFFHTSSLVASILGIIFTLLTLIVLFFLPYVLVISIILRYKYPKIPDYLC